MESCGFTLWHGPCIDCITQSKEGIVKRHLLSRVALAAAAFGLAGIATAAVAAPIGGTFTVNVWKGVGSGGIAAPEEQALPTNPLAVPGHLIASFTYTGTINFHDGGVNDIGTFLTSSGGTLGPFTVGSLATLGTTLSLGGFSDTSVMEFSGTTPQALSGAIDHDDGASLFQGGVNLLPADAAAPTVAVPTNYVLAPGAYDLWYVEANGLPAVLTMDGVPVPEPVTLSVLGLGLLGLGFASRRRHG